MECAKKECRKETVKWISIVSNKEVLVRVRVRVRENGALQIFIDYPFIIMDYSFTSKRIQLLKE